MRHVYNQTTPVLPSNPPTANVRLSPRSWPPRNKGDSKTHFAATRVAGRAGLPHLGTSVPVFSAVEGIQVHHHATGRFRSAYFAVPGRAHRHRWPTSISDVFRYCLTAVDRFIRWPEVIPLQDITAETVSRALLSGWISRYGCPQTITTDQGRQFESQLFHSLANMCGIHLSRTTAFHRAANGLVERMHRSLKAAIMCRAEERWTEALPLALLGMRTAFK